MASGYTAGRFGQGRQMQDQRMQDSQVQRQVGRRIKIIITDIMTGTDNAGGRHGRDGDRREEDLERIPGRRAVTVRFTDR
jgi:hypothetical protein